MAEIKTGVKIIFGIADPLPLLGFPEGTAEIRMSKTSWATVFVFDHLGNTRRFYIKEEEGNWVPVFEIVENVESYKLVRDPK